MNQTSWKISSSHIINFSDESGSDRDSGIETGDSGTAGLGTWSHSGHGLPVSYGLDRCDRSPVNSEDREKIREVLETGVRRMKLENKKTDQKHQGMDSHEWSLIFTGCPIKVTLSSTTWDIFQDTL